jgi:hypothetical protein
MGSTITMKGRRSALLVGLCSGCHLRSNAAGVLAVPVGAQGDHNDKRDDSPHKALLLSAPTGLALADSTHGRATGTQNVLCSFPSILVYFDLKREAFAESRALTVPWKRGNVDEHLGPTLNRRDESEAPIIIPLCESAFDTHMNGLSFARSRGSERRLNEVRRFSPVAVDRTVTTPNRHGLSSVRVP